MEARHFVANGGYGPRTGGLGNSERRPGFKVKLHLFNEEKTNDNVGSVERCLSLVPIHALTL